MKLRLSSLASPLTIGVFCLWAHVATATQPDVAAACSLEYKAIYQDSLSPGAQPVNGRYLVNPADLSYMNLSKDEIARVGAQMVEEYLNRPLSADAQNALTHAAADADQAKGLAEMSEALHTAGVTDNSERQALAQNIIGKLQTLANNRSGVVADAATAQKLRSAAENKLQAVVRANAIPSYTIQAPGGREVPVVLVNQSTYPELQGLLDRDLPFGDGVKLFPTNGNTDHGINRVGRRIEDFYFPNEVVGDVHGSGLGGKALGSLVQHSKGGNPIIEVAYALSPEEQKLVRLYHLVRRATLFMVRNKWNPGNPKYDGKTAVLERGHELCYTFGTGLCSVEHARNMYDYLMRMGVKNPDKLLQTPQVKKFLGAVYGDLAKLPIESPDVANEPAEQEKILHDWMLHQNPKYHKMLEGLMPKGLTSDEDQVRFLNYLVGIDISRKYAGLMKDLEFFDPVNALKPLNDVSVENRDMWPTFVNAAKKRAAAIFVYDNKTLTLEDFKNKIYQGAYYFMNPGEAPTRR